MGNASSGKGKNKYASSPAATLIVGADPSQQTGGTEIHFGDASLAMPPGAAPAARWACSKTSVLSFKALVEDLRQIRDERLYTREGFHCFRAWAMHTFGEKLGGWLDDVL